MAYPEPFGNGRSGHAEFPYQEIAEHASGSNTMAILALKKDFSRAEVKEPGHVLMNGSEIDALDRKGMAALPSLLRDLHSLKDKIAPAKNAFVTFPMAGISCGAPALAAAYQAASGEVTSLPFCDARLHECSIEGTSRVGLVAKLLENVRTILPRSLTSPHDGGVAGVRVGIEGIEVFNYLRAERIEMNIPHQFEQVRFFLAQNGFVTVLKKMARPLMTLVK